MQGAAALELADVAHAAGCGLLLLRGGFLFGGRLDFSSRLIRAAGDRFPKDSLEDPLAIWLIGEVYPVEICRTGICVLIYAVFMGVIFVPFHFLVVSRHCCRMQDSQGFSTPAPAYSLRKRRLATMADTTHFFENAAIYNGDLSDQPGAIFSQSLLNRVFHSRYNSFSGGTTNTHSQAPGMSVPPLCLGLVIWKGFPNPFCREEDA
jgi:hypothetical protein